MSETDKSFTPTPSLPLADGEGAAIDGVLQSIPSRMRRKAIVFSRPRFMEKEPEPLAKLDELIVEILTELKPKVPEDVAEKLYDRMSEMDVVEPFEDEEGSIAIMCYRFMDTMQCMVAIKEKYRGQKRTSKYAKKYATEQLRARGLLRR